MKKRYKFSLKNCLSLGLLAVFVFLVSPDLKAQNGPAVQWDRTFGGNNFDDLRAIQQTSDGGFFVAGFSDSGVGGDKSQVSRGLDDFWILKLDANGNKIWDKTYGGNLRDRLFSAQQTTDGGFILGGWSESGLSGDKSDTCRGGNDYWIIKLDANGNKLWDKTYGGTSQDLLYAIRQTADGGYIMGGHSSSGTNGDKSQASKGNMDYWILKLDANGNKIWDKSFGGDFDDIFRTLQQTSDGGYILGGASASPISGDKTQGSLGLTDFWVVRLDGNGNKVWDKTFGGTGHDGIKCMKQTSDGGFILGGNSTSEISGDKTQPHKGNGDHWVVKIDSNGNKMWDKTFGGSFGEQLESIHQNVDGSYFLGGGSSSPISGDKSQNCINGSWDFWLVKITSTGTKIWDKTIGGFDGEVARDMVVTNNLEIILAGESGSGIGGHKTQANRGNNSGYSFDFWIVKLAPDVLGTKETQPTFTLSLSPNPSHGKFNLHLSGLSAPTTEVTVTDLLGRTVLQQQFKTTNAQLSEEIKLPAAAKGMYLLQVKVNGQVTSRKIVVE